MIRLTRATYDWNKFGRPGVARFSRVLGWFVLTEAVLTWAGYFSYFVTRDWLLVFVPVVVTAVAVMQRLGMRRIYGVRPARPVRRTLEGTAFELVLDPVIFPGES